MKRKTMPTILVLILLIGLMSANSGYFTEKAYGASKAPKGNWINYAAKKFSGGDGTEWDPYIIKTPEQLALVAKKTNSIYNKPKGYNNAIYYKLTKDIDLSAHYWTPIGNVKGDIFEAVLHGKAFRGRLDGGWHTITGLTVAKGKKFAGLFGIAGDFANVRYAFDAGEFPKRNTDDGWKTEDFIPKRDFTEYGAGPVIKNLKLKGVNIQGGEYAGGLVGYSLEMQFYHCSVSGSVRGNKYAGLLSGRDFDAIAEHISVNGKVVSKGAAGGVFGVLNGCVGAWLKYGKAKVTVKGVDYVGGLIGRYSVETVYGSETLFCSSKDIQQVNVIGRNYVGGAVGYYDHQYTGVLEDENIFDAEPTTFKNARVKGKVTGKKYTGGICGYEGGQNINNCSFTGTVKGGDYTGGLFGMRESGPASAATIKNSYVKAKVTGKSNTGGLAGYLDYEYSPSIKKSYYSGKLTGGTNTGGLFGLAKLDIANFNMENSYVAGTIKGGANTGGLIGRIEGDTFRVANLSKSYISAAVTGSGSPKGVVFGEGIEDFHTKLSSFYYDSTKAKSLGTGIINYSNNPALYGEAKPVSTADLSRKKLAGFDYKKTWKLTKPKGKVGYLPQLQLYSGSKDKNARTDSLGSVKMAA